MDDPQKAQLEAKGWKVGNVDDFLGLTPEEMAYVELRMTLSRHLKTRRQR